MKYRKTNRTKQIDSGCRNNGTCGICTDNRLYSTTKQSETPEDIEIRERKQAAMVRVFETHDKMFRQLAKLESILVEWSELDGQYLATTTRYPSLSWFDDTEESARAGLMALMEDIDD